MPDQTNQSENAHNDAYKQAGVDIDKADNLLAGQKNSIDSATRPEVLSQVGAFGGLFELNLSRYKRPVLVSSVDGVGTKLMVANAVGKHTNVGYDLVHHCINDIAVQGAEPLFFMDYLGTGNLDKNIYEQVLEGLTGACLHQSVALLGGETAEMPGMYGEHYDLVGSITGIVDRERIITGEHVNPGDRLVAFPSNGLHTNGYSLARQVFFQSCGFTPDVVLPELGTTIGDALLRPHVCYLNAFRRAYEKGISIRAAVHVTGGGVYGNIPRVLPQGFGVTYDPSGIDVPAVFQAIADRGGVDQREMHKVFNMGAGMIWIVAPDEVDEVLSCGQDDDTRPVVAGEVIQDKAQNVYVRGVDT